MTDSPEFEIGSFTPYLLAMAAEGVGLGFSKTYKDYYGMSRTEWRVLFHLGHYGEMTATEIGQRAKLHKTKVSRAVRGLEEMRFLHRTTSETDRRVERLSLRAPGLQAYHKLSHLAADYEAKIMERLSKREADILKSALRKLSDI